MIQLYCEYPRKIIQNKKQIQKELSIKITNKAKIFFITGSVEQELIATSFIEAINLGFNVNQALDVKEENMGFEKINIKDHTKRGDLQVIRARIIGTKGKVLTTIENLTNTSLSLHNNSVGIIGEQEDLELASTAIKRLIQGSKHANVYAYLEKQQVAKKQNL